MNLIAKYFADKKNSKWELQKSAEYKDYFMIALDQANLYFILK